MTNHTNSPSPTQSNDEDFYQSPDFGEAMTVADACFAHFKREARLIMHVMGDEFFENGPLHGMSVYDMCAGYSVCVSDVLDAAIYLEARKIIAIDWDDAKDEDCPCPSCRARRTYVHLPYSFAADREIIIRRQQRDAQIAASSSVVSIHPRQSGYGHVYLIQCGPRYKIGITTDVDRRMAQLNNQQPYPLELVHSAYGAEYKQAERELHERYAGVRQHGEWFDFSPEQVAAVIESLNEWAARWQGGDAS